MQLSASWSWWEIVFALLIFYWPVMLAVAAILIVLGLMARGITRIILLSIPAIMLLVAGGMLGSAKLEQRERDRDARAFQADQARRRIVLKDGRKIAGLDLPAGTAVFWSDDALTKLDTANLPHPALILGAMLSGEIKREEFWWEVNLAEDTVIAGWPCRAGAIWLTLEGDARQCVLSKATTVSLPSQRKEEAMVFPAGTTLEKSAGSEMGHNLRLPQDKSIRLGEVDADLPGGDSVQLFPNGAVRSVYSSGDVPFAVQGIPFVTDAIWVYAEDLPDDSQGPLASPIAVHGELAKAIVCDDHRYEGGMFHFVRVNLLARTVELRSYDPDDHDRETKVPPIPTSHCKVATAKVAPARG